MTAQDAAPQARPCPPWCTKDHARHDDPDWPATHNGALTVVSPVSGWILVQAMTGDSPHWKLGQVYAHAAAVAQQTAAEITTARSGRADIAWATADLLTAAAEATGSPELRRAAEELSRAARAPWGRPQAPSTAGLMLRTAAYLLVGCAPARQPAATRRALIIAFAGLAHSVARLRAAQQRNTQAEPPVAPPRASPPSAAPPGAPNRHRAPSQP